jgi:hypothetical protein
MDGGIGVYVEIMHALDASTGSDIYLLLTNI